MASSATNLDSLLVEGDSVVITAELGGVGAHEDIADDDVLEVIGKLLAHDAHEALSLASTVVGLNDVVLAGENVVCGVEGKGDVGERVSVGAVLFDGDALD